MVEGTLDAGERPLNERSPLGTPSCEGERGFQPPRSCTSSTNELREGTSICLGYSYHRVSISKYTPPTDDAHQAQASFMQAPLRLSCE